MVRRKAFGIIALLALVWLLIVAWQIAEHVRVSRSAREALRNRARDISSTLGVVVRAMRRMGGFVGQERLEAALKELVESEEITYVALLNADGERVAQAGSTTGLDLDGLPEEPERWERNHYRIVNLVDLGLGDADDLTTHPPTIIFPDMDRDGPGFRRPEPSPDDEPPPPAPDEDSRSTDTQDRGRPPYPRPEVVERTSKSLTLRFELPPGGRFPGDRGEGGEGEEPRGDDRGPGFGRGPGRDRGAPPHLRRPFWMSEERYEELLQKRGLHGFMLVMSTQTFDAMLLRDVWTRFALIVVAFIAVAGFGIAWISGERSAELRIRLARASEMNAHLRELNLAAAGLAHETRNPLNLVRGLAQMVSRDPGVSEGNSRRASEIVEEVDRVTSRLNEFISYSKPREPKLATVAIRDVIRDVDSTLETDRHEKGISFAVECPELNIAADEALLRQVLFNLTLNAVQAVQEGGHIRITLERTGGGEARMEIQDDGPGVPPEHRSDIFRPYFTTTESGTGLGLAVVRQIVLAHHWEINYRPAETGGACFVVSGLRVVTSAA